ncbi:hypothetical protein BJX99DRAFT_231224 [Aspergillus californicus]
MEFDSKMISPRPLFHPIRPLILFSLLLRSIQHCSKGRKTAPLTMRIPPPEHSLFQFLKSALQVHQNFISGALSRAESPIYVIGNPSADLDSIISALVYSYFANNRVPRDYPRPHVPVINLDKVPTGPELRRLRPEFVKALQLSRHAGKTSEVEESSLLKEHFLTVADFAAQLEKGGFERQIQADSVLVDWNALPIRSPDNTLGKGSVPGLSTVDFTVVGCIDHHADEKFLPPIANAQPHLVEPTGSCTSLVMATLEKMGLWQKHDTNLSASELAHEEEVAKLALVPILIDTANLTSKEKVTEFDTTALDFLLPKATTANHSWDATKFYNKIHETKQNSLELLTVDEILDRDYKEWTESPSDQSPLQIGICSTVKSISWIVRKAGSSEAFLDYLKAFASQRTLDIVTVMTAFSSVHDGQFSRELLVCALNARGVDAVKSFVSDSSSKLGLEDWYSLDGDDYAQDIKDTLRFPRDTSSWTRLWVQTNKAQSRKQVAPLIRGAAASL